MADIAASVLAKLRNKAKASGISYQRCLQLFMQEEFLRKLSNSGYGDFLILKGGLFIYTLTNFESRATIDVDFLLRGYSNSIDDVKNLICKVIETPTGNDYIEMEAKGFEEISPQRKYHGISTQIIGRIKNVRVPFNVDIGVGDVIVPKAEQRKISTQLPDFEAPVIKTYSIESTIAEKFDAILQRFELTGRMKDFYDIYYLSRTVTSQQKWTRKSFKKRNESQYFVNLLKSTALFHGLLAGDLCRHDVPAKERSSPRAIRPGTSLSYRLLIVKQLSRHKC